MSVNKIITRGMGPSRGASGRASLVTQGYAGIFQQIADIARRIYGGSGVASRRKKEEQYAIVSANLISVDDIEPTAKIQGSIRILLSQLATNIIVEQLTTKVTQALSVVASFIKR